MRRPWTLTGRLRPTTRSRGFGRWVAPRPWAAARPRAGVSPAMYWYGFIITAALAALAVTAVAAVVPDKLMDRVPWRSLTWLVPLAAIIYIGYVLLPYATKV